MMRETMLCLAVTLLCVSGAYGAECHMTKNQYPHYPPPANATMPHYTIDLDVPAEDRWAHIVTPHTDGIRNLLKFTLSGKFIANEIIDKIAAEQDEILANFPSDYGDELRGIAKATNISVSQFILFNMAYEIWGLCTSIVAEDDKGHIYHGRNLDFGLWPAWDSKGDDWTLTELLRPLLFQADVMKGGKVLYHITNYAGYVGVHTGMKPHAFSVTIDSRFDDNFDSRLLAWLKPNSTHTGKFVSFTVRQALEQTSSYSEALTFLNDTGLIGPAYLILGGMQPGEGAVITKESAETLDVMTINGRMAQHKQKFVVQTNYDNWKSPPWFDDRRIPAIDCMEQLTPSGTNLPGLFNVLSAKPNLNRLTTFTVLIDVMEDSYNSYKQRCAHEGCTLW